MPDELTPEEQDILANSPADAPVIVGDDDTDEGEAPPDATEADPEAEEPSEAEPSQLGVAAVSGARRRGSVAGG